MSPAGHSTWISFVHFFPTFHLSLRSVHCRSLGHESYKYPLPGLVERQATVAPSLSLLVCVCVLYDPFRLTALEPAPIRSDPCVFPRLPSFRLRIVPSRRRIAMAVGITTHVYRPPFARSRVLVSGTRRGLFLSFLFRLSRGRPGSTFNGKHKHNALPQGSLNEGEVEPNLAL
jgi:hypothetical protein